MQIKCGLATFLVRAVFGTKLKHQVQNQLYGEEEKGRSLGSHDMEALKQNIFVQSSSFTTSL